MYRDEEKKFDIRVLDKHFPVDDASRAQIYTHIDALPDVSSKIDTDYTFDFSSVSSESDTIADDENVALPERSSPEVNS